MSYLLTIKPHFVYKAFDKLGCLLYVGITYDLKSRMKMHRNQSTWWNDAVYFQIDKHSNRHTAQLSEYDIIMNEYPVYNIQIQKPKGHA